MHILSNRSPTFVMFVSCKINLIGSWAALYEIKLTAQHLSMRDYLSFTISPTLT